MKDKCRLVNGEELYNVAEDPLQKDNVIEKFPELAQSMSEHYEAWYKNARKGFEQKRYIIVGSPKANPVKLYASDWLGGYCDNPKNLRAADTTGYFNLEVDRAGEYAIEMRRWPQEPAKRLTHSYDGITTEGARPIAKARLRIGDVDDSVDLDPRSSAVTMSVQLKKGKTELLGEFLDKNGDLLCGAIYMKVTRL